MNKYSKSDQQEHMNPELDQESNNNSASYQQFNEDFLFLKNLLVVQPDKCSLTEFEIWDRIEIFEGVPFQNRLYMFQNTTLPLLIIDECIQYMCYCKVMLI